MVLDLRRNGGGDPGTVTLVLDWLLGGEPTHISDVIYRDRTRQWWTTGRLADLAPPPETPVSVLVGERTFSSGEGLAYHLQSQGRARLVGQRTPGAADHITPVRLSRHVRALLPEARVRDAVTGTNWEGAGVVPDIPCEPAEGAGGGGDWGAQTRVDTPREPRPLRCGREAARKGSALRLRGAQPVACVPEAREGEGCRSWVPGLPRSSPRFRSGWLCSRWPA